MDTKTRIPAGAVAGAGALAATKVTLDRRNGHDDGGGPSRGYRLKRKETATAGMRRIAAGRADDAIEQLRERAPEDFAPAVHEARKDLKKFAQRCGLCATTSATTSTAAKTHAFATAAGCSPARATPR